MSERGERGRAEGRVRGVQSTSPGFFMELKKSYGHKSLPELFAKVCTTKSTGKGASPSNEPMY